jgi:dipeptidyl aminopeptidase/acylaminoacyl peptidase
MTVTGEAESIAEQTGNLAALGFYTASPNGVLAYRGGNETAAQVTWFDRQGNNLGTVGPPQFLLWATISPDGNTVAEDRQDGIWTYSFERGAASRLTFNSVARNRYPIWSPDGSYVAFSSAEKDGTSTIYKKASNGTGADEVLDKDSRVKIAYDWSRDGQYIIEGVLEPKTKWDIWVLPLTGQTAGGEKKAFPYLQTDFNEQNARLSPDGRWIAYSSDETDRDEIYVQTFPQHVGKWQVSTNGGSNPVWSHDGKQLFFISGDGKMTAVEVKNAGAKNPQFEASSPVPLFDARLGFLSGTRFDVAKDGRFLIPRQASQTAPTPITVLANWESALKN